MKVHGFYFEKPVAPSCWPQLINPSTVSPQSQWDQSQERGGPAAEPYQVLPRTVQVRPDFFFSYFFFAQTLMKPVTTTCFLLFLLSSFFQDGLKAVDNLKPSIEKLATDLHTVSRSAGSCVLILLDFQSSGTLTNSFFVPWRFRLNRFRTRRESSWLSCETSSRRRCRWSRRR